jgi:hypothetical protein
MEGLLIRVNAGDSGRGNVPYLFVRHQDLKSACFLEGPQHVCQRTRRDFKTACGQRRRRDGLPGLRSAAAPLFLRLSQGYLLATDGGVGDQRADGHEPISDGPDALLCLLVSFCRAFPILASLGSSHDCSPLHCRGWFPYNDDGRQPTGLSITGPHGPSRKG